MKVFFWEQEMYSRHDHTVQKKKIKKKHRHMSASCQHLNNTNIATCCPKVKGDLEKHDAWTCSEEIQYVICDPTPPHTNDFVHSCSFFLPPFVLPSFIRFCDLCTEMKSICHFIMKSC